MSKNIYIKQTPLGGWKCTAIIALLAFLSSVVAFFSDPTESLLLFFVGCGWAGWAIQEKEHLEGKKIIK